MCCGGVHRAAPNSLAWHRGDNYGKLQRERGNVHRVDAYEPRRLPVSQIIHVVASYWFERWAATRQRAHQTQFCLSSTTLYPNPPRPSSLPHPPHTHTFYCVERVSQHQRDRRGWQHRLYKTDQNVFLWRRWGQECGIQSRILQAGGYDE